MKNKIFSRITALIAVIILLGCVSGCKDMFIDPLKDKNTGGTVTLLLVDRNFIKTKFYVHLVDYNTGTEITAEPVDVYFLGRDSINMVSFTGERKAKYTTSSAFIEVGYDPNVVVSAAKPIEFKVVALSANYVSVPQVFKFTTEGVKDLVIKMIHAGTDGPGLKAAFDEPFDLKFNDVMRSPSLSFLSGLSSTAGGGYSYVNLYKSAASGRLTASNLKDNVKYSDYGVEAYGMGPAGFYDFFSTNPALKDMPVHARGFVATMDQWTGLQACNTGLTIHVDGPSGGSATFNYRIDFSDGSMKEGRITCVFPCDNVIDQIYYPTADERVTVTLLGDAQYNISDAVSLDSPCGSTATFTATPKSNLKSYKFITRYTCADNPVGFALSIAGQFRTAGSSEAWTSFAFAGGICELRLAPGSDYEFRVNIDGEYHNFTLPVDPATIEAALRNNQSADYKLNTIVISVTDLLITVNAEVQFSSGICDLIK